MEYVVQIILSSNTNLDILVKDVIDTLQKAGFTDIEVIKCHSYSKDSEGKLDATKIEFELKLPEKNLAVIDYLHKITDNKLIAYKIRIAEMEY